MTKTRLTFVLILIAAIAVVQVKEMRPSPTLQASSLASTNADDQFGVAWINPPGRVANDKRLQQALDLGARWDRFPFYWDQLQTASDRAPNFEAMDSVVNNDISHGIKVQGILLGLPGWANQGGKVSMSAWQDFVFRTVQHYKGSIQYWEIWNEPDLLDANGKGFFWWSSVEDYYELLKTGYKAVKAADPDAKVLMAGLAFPYNNLDFFPRLLSVMSKDPTAKDNGYYFDALPLHIYGRVAPVYDLAMGYLGEPDFVGFHNMMAAYGFDKPIWINETGVPVWDTESGKNAPGRATRDEQASYIIQAFAYARVAGIEKVFVHQLYDDGAGAIDPQNKLPAEFFGLISNAGEQRPAYTAYQIAAAYFSNTKLATRVNLDRTGLPTVKGVEIISFYGTPNGKITVVWNSDPGITKTVRIPATTGQALLMNKLGKTSQIAASGKAYELALAPATNNNNFGCQTPSGCQPNDYIIGGDPLIIIEDDKRVPPAAVAPLQSGVAAPFNVSWHPTRDLTGTVTYDVQYMDAAEGKWRDWFQSTSATSAVFGDGWPAAQKNHTYLFRVRAWQNNKLVDGYDYTPGAMASTVVLGGKTVDTLPVQSPLTLRADAKIEIVWPHESKPVTEATQVNISSYLFRRQTSQAIGPSWDGKVKLYRSLNNGIEEEVGVATKRNASAGGLSFPAWDFNDVNVSQAQDPSNKYFFRLGVEGAQAQSTIWSHGADARTYFPATDVPTGVLTTTPSAVDAKIEVVWPQGNLPVDQATKVNIAVYVFGHGTLNSVSTVFTPTVKLWRALNNGVEEEIGRAEKVTKKEGDLVFPVWSFDNINVSEARDPTNKYFFRVTVEGVPTFSNIWSHGEDGRTYFPKIDVPSGVDE